MESNGLYEYDCCVLSTAYLPPVEYFAAIANSSASQVLIEACEIFQKQSYRSRCYIYSANGPLVLNVPVRRGGADFTHKLPIREIEIDYDEAWIPLHEKALEAAYMNSPFFEFYKDDLFKILDGKEKYLFDLNRKLLEYLLQMTGIKANIKLTTDYVADYEKERPADVIAKSVTYKIADFRSSIHPKSKLPSLLKQLQMEKPYWQVFSSKQGFIPNLSVADLLFNEGPNAITYLLKN
ncbi:MAG: WbqC family protein [Bacteroidales bacterium]|jgi:hypothetical protein|nr:WbqC family protein [Bacteroidales bacterium]MCI1733996.1 WbqC family protein [Bacteroidales bacterium]